MATIRRTTLRTGAALAVTPGAVAGVAGAAGAGVAGAGTVAALAPSTASIEAQLRDWLVGQRDAVAAVTAAIARWRAGDVEPGRPLASLLFLGPNGVGKTHLAKAAAVVAFSSPEAFTRVDVRAADPAALADRVRARPEQVVLLDEVDKASDAALGWLRDIVSRGRARGADFSRALVILTSIAPAPRLDGIAALTERVTFLPLTPAEREEVQRRMNQKT